MEIKLTETQEKSAKLLAHVLHGINSARTVEQWEEHIRNNGHDAKAFFGDNGAGYDEYLAFVNTHDKDKYEARMRKIAQKRNT